MRVSFFVLSQKKETKEKATPLPLVSFGLSATLVRLRNSGCALRQSSPFNPAYAQAEGAARGFKVKTMRMPMFNEIIDALEAA
jgi:hypothetical protein